MHSVRHRVRRGDIEDKGEKKEQTEYVVTRWYRAPEIMLGYSTYDYAIDVWSLGCIFGEILGREALLPGGDYVEQLKLISALLGSPTEDDLWYVSNRNAREFMMRLPKYFSIALLALKFLQKDLKKTVEKPCLSISLNW